MNEKFAMGRIVSARREVNNSVATGAAYGIKGVAVIDNGVVTSVSDGEVTGADGVTVATFSKWNGGGLNVNYTRGEEGDSIGILQAIDEFTGAVIGAKVE